MFLDGAVKRIDVKGLEDVDILFHREEVHVVLDDVRNLKTDNISLVPENEDVVGFATEVRILLRMGQGKDKEVLIEGLCFIITVDFIDKVVIVAVRVPDIFQGTVRTVGLHKDKDRKTDKRLFRKNGIFGKGQVFQTLGKILIYSGFLILFHIEVTGRITGLGIGNIEIEEETLLRF